MTNPVHPAVLTRYYLHARTRDLVAYTSSEGRTLVDAARGGWTEIDRDAYETLLRQRAELRARLLEVRVGAVEGEDGG